MYASPTGCTHAKTEKKKKKKKNATEVTVSDYAAEPSSRGGPPMCSPFVLAKVDHLISSPFFYVNLMHF